LVRNQFRFVLGKADHRIGFGDLAALHLSNERVGILNESVANIGTVVVTIAMKPEVCAAQAS
jgi:hypothetical protein